MEETNTIHLSQLPNLRKFKEKQKAARQRRIEKFAKEKLLENVTQQTIQTDAEVV